MNWAQNFLLNAGAERDELHKSWRGNDDFMFYLEGANLIGACNQGETDGKWLRETDRQAGRHYTKWGRDAGGQLGIPMES